MANVKEIQDRIKSIHDTMKITNAMYMISSSKMKKAKKALSDTEPYFFEMQSAIRRILRHVPDIEHAFFDERPEIPKKDRKIGHIIVTADKGLAGAYNHNVIKMAEEQLQWEGKHSIFTGMEANIIDLEGKLDEIHVIYTNMENAVTNETQTLQLLPLKKASFHTELKMGIPADVHHEEIMLVPSADEVLNTIIPNYVVGTIYGCLVESYCSEQNARMTAMDASNRNASEMLKALSIQYNRARQAAITQEITEVIAGAKAQKNKHK